MRNDLLLVTFDYSYADEFDVRGSSVMSQSEYDSMIGKTIAKVNENSPVELWFGTNECVELYDEQDVRDAYQITSITEEQAAFLKSLPNGSLGTFLRI